MNKRDNGINKKGNYMIEELQSPKKNSAHIQTQPSDKQQADQVILGTKLV